MQKFERWLHVRDVRSLPELPATGLSSLVAVTVEYLRGAIASAALSSGEVGTLILGIRRFLLLAQAMEAEFDDTSVLCGESTGLGSSQSQEGSARP